MNLVMIVDAHLIFIMFMKQDQFLIHKQSFIKSRRQSILDFYEFHPKELGRGAFGVVYKAKSKNSQDWRAIKKIHKKNIKDSQTLISEIQILKSLDHPTIIKLYETFEDQNNLFLVMDFCEGGELFERLDTAGNFSEEDARNVFIQISEAVSYLHHNKICHRDLKPQNFLFLNKKGLNIKLIDFGLGFRWNQNMKKQLEDKGANKKLVGTSYYIAPEVIGTSYDQKCDIWSIGVILYVLLTAAPPFDGENDQQIISQVKTMNYSLEIPELEAVSKKAKDLITKILKPECSRVSLQQIFEDEWVTSSASTKPLKVKFSQITNFSKFSKMKKLAATYIATQLSEKQVESLGNLFRKMDLNHDGEISLEEFKQALDDKEMPSCKEITDLMAEIDTDKSGNINYVQFLASFTESSKLFSEQKIKAMFKSIDKDGNGFVDKSELMELLKTKDIKELNDKNVEEIIAQSDKDGNGLIDYNEFKASILN